MSYVWGVAFSKDIGAEKAPRSNSARFVSTVYAFMAMIIVNTYCANLMAFLVQDNFVLPIDGIRDPKVCRGYNFCNRISETFTHHFSTKKSFVFPFIQKIIPQCEKSPKTKLFSHTSERNSAKTSIPTLVYHTEINILPTP